MMVGKLERVAEGFWEKEIIKGEQWWYDEAN